MDNKDKRIEYLERALMGLVGDTGIVEDECNCDNGHEQNMTVCDFCFAKNVLNMKEV